MLHGLSLFFISLMVQGAELNVPLATVYMKAQDEIVPKLCHDSICVISANAAYKGCYTADLKKHSTTEVPAAEAQKIGDELYACTVQAMKLNVTNRGLNQNYLRSYHVADAAKPAATPAIDEIAKIPITARYLLRLKTMTDEMTALKARIKARDRSLCPGYQGVDMSGCTARGILTAGIDTSAEPVLALTLIVLAGVDDKSRLGPAAANFMLNACLEVAEHVNKKAFFLRKTPLMTDQDQLEQKSLLRDDDLLLATGFSKVVEMITQRINEIPKRQPAAVVTGVPTRAQLEARLKNLQRHPW